MGGRTVKKWREGMLAVAFLSLGIAILLATLIESLWSSAWAAPVSLLLIWIGMLAPVVWALTRSRPAGLLKFRPLDLLFGVVLGAVLRVVQGWLETATGGSGALPSYPLIDGQLAQGWLITDAVGPALVAPVVEEFFFRGILLVVLFTIFRRALGRTAAGVVAILLSTAVFVLMHALTLDVSVSTLLSVTLLGLTCAGLVMATGRIWGAVLVHVVFNATFVGLALLGTFFA